MGKFDEVFQASVENPEKFWEEAAKDITWYKEPDKVLDSSNAPFYKWFPGGKMNTCYNATEPLDPLHSDLLGAHNTQ